MRPCLAATLAMLASAAGQAQPAASEAARPPRLLIFLSVDQLSAELFEEYRPHFTGGLARVARGTWFRNAYQAHGTTETCPGEATMLTGRYPANSGIIANRWLDQSISRQDKWVNCAEDERVAGSNSRSYTVSPVHLRVPTLGDLLKRRSPGSAVVSVAGKDRSAVMLSGSAADQRWHWSSGSFRTDLAAAAVPRSVGATNAAVAAMIAAPQAALEPPPVCSAKARPVQAGSVTVGTGRFERAGGDVRGFRGSPAFDGATLALAAALAQEMALGRDASPDLLTIGLAGTDAVGHSYGSGGQEMCLQLLSLDRDLADFFRLLDLQGIDYAVALTADHGSMDLPERLRERVPQAARADPALEASKVGARIADQFGLRGPVLLGDVSGDVWLDRSLPAALRSRALATAVSLYRAHPQVEAVFTADELARAPMPLGPPDRWTLKERVRASFDPSRSGNFYVALKPYVSPIAKPGPGIVAGHGTPWDYDRRVPILIWRSGMRPSERPQAAATVDLLPTLAVLLGLGAPPQPLDGRCLEGIAGVECPL